MDVFSELIKAQLENRTTDPSHNGQVRGLMWFNKAANKIKAAYNTVNEILATESWVTEQITTAVSGSEGELSTNGLVTSEQASDPSAPAAGFRRLFAKATGLHEMGSDGIAYLLEKSANNKVKELVVEEWRQTDSNGSSSPQTYTVGNAPSGWAWMFIAQCKNSELASGVWEGRDIEFDGNTFTPSKIVQSSVAGGSGFHSPTVLVFGAGTGGGNIQITFQDNNDYHSGAGMFIKWKL